MINELFLKKNEKRTSLSNKFLEFGLRPSCTPKKYIFDRV